MFTYPHYTMSSALIWQALRPRITHGPVSDPRNVRFALEKLLRTKGYAFAAVSGSMLPLRVGL